MSHFRGKGELTVHHNGIKRAELFEAHHSQIPSVTSNLPLS